MKRFILSAFLIFTATAPVIYAQETTPLPPPASPEAAPAPITAAGIAARQEADENYNTLRGQMDELMAANADQRRKIMDLTRQIEDLKQQAAKPRADSASADDLKQLAATVQEIDKKREADKQLILDEIRHLGKVVGDGSSSRTQSRALGNTGTTAPRPVNTNQEGYTYTVKKGDSLGIIVQKYRDQGIMVTRKMIIDNNPNLNPDLLYVGAKIWFPEPKK